MIVYHIISYHIVLYINDFTLYLTIVYYYIVITTNDHLDRMMAMIHGTNRHEVYGKW